MITATQAQQRLTSAGIGSMGLASGMLSPRWSETVNDMQYNWASLSITASTTDWYAPFGGSLTYRVNGAPELTDADGNPVAPAAPGNNVALFCMHPQAHLRLEQLYVARYGGASRQSFRPVPHTIAIANPQLQEPTPVETLATAAVAEVEAYGPLPSGQVTFHDRRGLIIDPLAVLAAFLDLTQPNVFETLLVTGNLVETNDGTMQQLYAAFKGALASTFQPVRIHVVNPHGAPWQDPGAGIGLQVRPVVGGTGTHVSGHLLALPTGQVLDREPQATNVRLGLATVGPLNTGPFVVPPFPAPTTYPIAWRTTAPAAVLDYDFVRVCAVDLNFHLLGNRAAGPATRENVPGVDTASAAEPPPVVRDSVPIAYLTDGVQVMTTIEQLLAAVPTGQTFEAYLVSPDIRDDFAIPPAGAPGTRWPLYPTPTGGAQFINVVNATQLRAGTGLAAAFVTGSFDVVLTIAAGALPVDAHVRVFPRRFFTGPSLDKSPTLFRGDGAAAIVPPAANAPTQLQLVNPLNLGPNEKPPSSPRLLFDLLVVPRMGPSRLFGGMDVPITASNATALTPPATNNGMSRVPNQPGQGFRGACHVPILGLPPVVDPPTDWSDPTAALQLLVNTSSPREAPRFPTMARRESIVALRTPGPVQNNVPTSVWQGVLTGGFLNSESLTANYRRGNPGQRAGREVHVTGVQVGGALAYDLGFAAVRRSRPLLMEAGSNSWTIPRSLSMANPNWDVANVAAPAAATTAGALLQTVAPDCETPYLSMLVDETDITSPTFPTIWNDLMNWIEGKIEALILKLTNQQVDIDLNGLNLANGDTLVADVRREAFAVHYGRRDAQWALRRAIMQARDLIYIETPAFGPTTYLDGPAAPGQAADPLCKWDLLGTLTQRLLDCPNLRVVLAMSKELDYPPAFGGWAKQGYDFRTTVVNTLRDNFGDQVLAFHPMGFSGRPLQIRGTVVVVDDVWCLVGASTLRRRGLTFDGASDIVSFDRNLLDGRSAAITQFRRALMAMHLNVAPPPPITAATPATVLPDPTWVRLEQPQQAFAAFRDVLDAGGRGLIEPYWEGPGTDLALDTHLADPEGREVGPVATAIMALLTQLGDPKLLW